MFFMFIGLLSSCYDEFRLDNEYSSVAFSSMDGGSNTPGVLWRTVVMGEGLKMDTGIYLAGILNNKDERWANFQIDASLLSGTPYKIMPDDYYTLSNDDRFVIPSGKQVGRVTISLDSTKFVNDTSSTKPYYAIPFRLTETSEDSILSSQNTQILAIKYINKYEGFYNQKGTFKTLSATEEELSSGQIDNVLDGNTVFLDTIELNGAMNKIGDDVKMKLNVNADNTVYLQYSPNLNKDNSPKNIALEATVSASYTAPWNNVTAVQSGEDPVSSAFASQETAWANYGAPTGDGGENWIEYSFSAPYSITKVEVYWVADGGGVQIPNNSYIQYWDLGTEEWKLLSDNIMINGASVAAADYGVINAGNEADRYNVTTFDKIDTDKIRVYCTSPTFTGMNQWKVWGVPAPAGFEAAAIESIEPNGENTYDPTSSTLKLNYRVKYKSEDYHTDVSTELVWRNRIRDGVNEWRR